MKNNFTKLLTLLFLLTVGMGTASAYTTSNGSITFSAGEKLIIDFTEVQNFNTFEDGGKMSASVQVSGTIVTLTFSSNKTFNQNVEMFHWQYKNGSTYSWQHNGVEWFRLSSTAGSATGSVPCPNVNDATYLKVTQSTVGGACTFTWMGGAAPEPAAPAIDGCDGCFKITEE